MERLAALARNHVRFAATHAAYYRVMFGARIGEQKANPTRLAEVARPTLEVVARTAAELPLRAGVTPLQAAVLFWAGAHGIAILALDGQLAMLGQRSVRDLEDLAEIAVRSMAEGLREPRSG